MTKPAPCVLYCPYCKKQHIDRPPWDKRKHRTHKCSGCGFEWRPAAWYTVGVLSSLLLLCNLGCSPPVVPNCDAALSYEHSLEERLAVQAAQIDAVREMAREQTCNMRELRARQAGADRDLRFPPKRRKSRLMHDEPTTPRTLSEKDSRPGTPIGDADINQDRYENQ